LIYENTYIGHSESIMG